MNHLRLPIRFLFLCLLAQTSWSQIYYSVSKTTALSGASEVITIQQPASGAAVLRFIGAYIDCSVACTGTIERNGTAATNTTLTIANVNPGETSPVSTAWSSSNVGTGTVISRFSIPASGATNIDLSKVYLAASGGTNKNLTIRTSSITGTVNIVIIYSEIM